MLVQLPGCAEWVRLDGHADVGKPDSPGEGRSKGCIHLTAMATHFETSRAHAILNFSAQYASS